MPQNLVWHPSAKSSQISLILLHFCEGCQLSASGILREFLLAVFVVRASVVRTLEVKQ